MKTNQTVVGEQDNGRVMEIVDCAGQSAGKGGQFGKEKNRRTETEKGKSEGNPKRHGQ